MSFRIDAYSRVTPGQVRNDALSGTGQVKRSGVGESGGGKASDVDRVSVSQEARRLAEQQSTKSTEQIEQLRKSISEGSYKVDAGAIAARIVNGD